MAERVPAQTFPPGDFIREELEARGWTQESFAAVLGRPLQFVNELLSGRKSVTPETATGLAEAFKTSAEFWLNLDLAYRLGLHREKEAKAGKKAGEVAKRSQLYELAPVKDMVKRKSIEPAESAEELEQNLNRFFGRKVLQDPPQLAHAAKKGTTYSTTTPAQLAWVFRARQLASGVPAAKFNHESFVRGLPKLRQLIVHEAAARLIPKALAELGIRLVVVEHLPGSRMDGATIWLTPGKPVVILSVRYDRIDNLWFVLAHELAHVVNGDEGSVDADLVGDSPVATESKPEAERLADLWASEYLIDPDEIEGFVQRTHPVFSKNRINQFANRVKVHPGIIVGQLQRRFGMPYSHNREMLVKVREQLIGAAMTDGWGHTPVINWGTE